MFKDTTTIHFHSINRLTHQRRLAIFFNILEYVFNIYTNAKAKLQMKKSFSCSLRIIKKSLRNVSISIQN